MDDYIAQAMRTEGDDASYVERFERLRNNMRVLHACMGLTTEVGELTDALKKHIMYGKKLDPVNLAEEGGDILWYLAILFDELGVDFDRVMRANIAKLRHRYPHKFTEQHALNRDLDGERKVLEAGQ